MFQIKNQQLDVFRIPQRKKAREKILLDLQSNRYKKVYEAGRNILIEDSYGNITTLVFSEGFVPEKIIKPSGLVYRFGYDDNSQLTTFFYPNNEKIQLNYNKDLVESIAINNELIKIKYDDKQRVVKIIDPDNLNSSFNYDSNGKIDRFTNRAGESKSYGAAIKNGTLVYTIKDSLDRNTEFELAQTGNIKKIIFPDRTTQETFYHEELETERTKARNGTEIITSYDEFFASSVQYEDGNFVNIDTDGSGLVHSLENENGTIFYEYNDEQIIKSESFQNNETKHIYNEDKLLAKIIYPKGFEVTYFYDCDGRLEYLEANNQQCKFKYEKNDTISEINYPNGIIELRQQKALGRLENVKLTNTVEKNIAYQHYKYDSLSRLIEYSCQTSDTKQKDFKLSYDAESRLTGCIELNSNKKETFKYDVIGNMSECNDSKVIIGPMNELLQVNGQFLSYDKAGNINSFSNERGNIIKLRFNNIGVLKFATTTTGEWEYWYDSLGRRIAKSNGKETYKYTWSGDKLTAEEHTNKSITTVRNYLYTPYSDISIGFFENEKLYFLHSDMRGAIYSVTDYFGNLVWVADYNSFGKANISINNIRQPWRLAGQYFDEETGLHYNYARYYSPDLKTYLSLDPTWYDFQATNYSYALNNPFNRIDLKGKLSLGLALGIGIGAVVIGSCLGGPLGAAIGGLVAGGIIGALSEEKGPWWHGALKGVTTSAIIEIGVAGGLIGVIAGSAVAGAVDSFMSNSLLGEEICIPCMIKQAKQFAKTGALFGVATTIVSPVAGNIFASAKTALIESEGALVKSERALVKSESSIEAKLVKEPPPTANANNNVKGIYGEHVTDVEMQNKGFKKLNDEGETVMPGDKPKGNGIDSIWENPKYPPPPKYYIVESKFSKDGRSNLNTLDDGTRQMEDKWVSDRIGSTKGITNSQSSEITESMLKNDGKVEKILVKIDAKGNPTYFKLDKKANIIGEIKL